MVHTLFCAGFVVFNVPQEMWEDLFCCRRTWWDVFLITLVNLWIMVFHPSVFSIMTCSILVFQISCMLYVHPCLLGSFFLDPEDVRSLSLQAVWNFSKGTGFPWIGHQIMGHRGPVQRAYLHRDWKGSNPFTNLLCSVLHPFLPIPWLTLSSRTGCN